MIKWVVGIGGTLIVAALIIWLAWYMDPNR